VPRWACGLQGILIRLRQLEGVAGTFTEAESRWNRCCGRDHAGSATVCSKERPDENRHPLLRRLRLRAQSPRCEGTPVKTGSDRRRARPLERRGIRDRGRRPAQVLQEGARPLPHRQGNRRVGEGV